VPRDNPGNTIKFSVPTIINGKVYVGSEFQVSVFGLLNGATQAAPPMITPGTESFASSVQVTMTDSTTGAHIYYTTDGVTTPTTNSTQYSSPITVTSTQTIQAIAAGPSLLASTVASATYTLNNQVATPTFSPTPGAYPSPQTVSINTTTPSSTIYYTLGGTTPTTSSTKYTGPVSIASSTTLQAFATSVGVWVNFLLLTWFAMRAGLMSFDTRLKSSAMKLAVAGLALAAALALAAPPVIRVCASFGGLRHVAALLALAVLGALIGIDVLLLVLGLKKFHRKAVS